MAARADPRIVDPLMYKHIMVPVENSPTDAHILDHVKNLARFCGASVVLIHVADGWAARNIRHLDLRESEEMREDRAYLERTASELERDGLKVEALLAVGDPAREITAAAEREKCDLIAMATHGHKFIADVVYGSVANAVRHATTVPVLLLRRPVTT
ncbi:MAG TPA: universal stress protein [Gemmatimonadaceae bacterium]|nr:universal stress protein [Gemmatimonadaceae bacterium]